MNTASDELFIGLMSGTSMDGIDAVLVDFSATRPKLLRHYSQPWPGLVQQALIDARELPDNELNSLNDLDMQAAEVFADACFNLLKESQYKAQDVSAIGNHGQTIRHRPDIAEPFSLQIGNAGKLAELTGIDVISDFRSADIQAGGQGAPLAPAFHQAIFCSEKSNRVIVNIGGIANITRLPKDKNQPITGFDCGPGNTLMDAWTVKYRQQAFDRNGDFAASGKTSAALLARLLMDDFFQKPPPKSTGFEYFNLNWLSEKIQKNDNSKLSDADIQSTLCDLTATSIIRAINQYADDTEEIYVCGGGVHNTVLMQRLQALTKCPLQTTEPLGVHPDWVEAMAFAWLARQYRHQQSGNLPAVTGADREVVLGSLTAKPC